MPSTQLSTPLPDQRVAHGRPEPFYLDAAGAEHLIAFLVRVSDIARLAHEGAQRMHLERSRRREFLEQLARLLFGHRDYELSFFQQLGVSFEIGRGRLVADMNSNISQRHSCVERNQRAVPSIRCYPGRAHAHVLVETAILKLAHP